jgi:7-cyano-7-deazaguanine synthase in queuosine biosynthesis
MEYSLVSGGMDSFCGFNLYAASSVPVFINYGQHYATAELSSARKLFKNLVEITIKGGDLGNEIFIPNRNNTMACLIASLLKDVSVINIFGIKDDVCQDKNERAYVVMGKTISLFSDRKVIVTSPTQHLTKNELLAKYILAFGKDKLNSIFSCYYPINGIKPCNNCPACLRLEMAFFSCGVQKFSLNNDILNKYIQRTDLKNGRKRLILQYASSKTRRGL